MRAARRTWSSAVVAVAAGALLAGCSGAADTGAADTAAADTDGAEPAAAEQPEGPKVIQPGAPGERSRELEPEEVEALDFDVYNEADIAFMQGMIAHHVQALRMTAMVPSRSDSEDVNLFAERIDVSQDDEIDLMRRWLEDRDEEVPSLLASHDHGGDGEYGDYDGELMPGMLTEEELAELEATTGEEFDRLFLEYMIGHHLGALAMVQELFDNDGAMEPQLSQFANHVYSDQEIEILRMYSMLEEMGVDINELEPVGGGLDTSRDGGNPRGDDGDDDGDS